MLKLKSFFFAVPLAALLLCGTLNAAENGLSKEGKPELKSAGPLAFGPSGVLFVGDPLGASIYAIGVDASAKAAPVKELKLEGIDKAIAGVLGTTPADLVINDLAVQPGTGLAYLSVSRGKGPDAIPVIVRVDGEGKVTEVPLDKVAYSQVTLKNAPAAGETKDRRAPQRADSITDIAFIDNRVFVAGISNEEFASKLRAIPFPFKDADQGTSVEIYHGAHGAVETRAPIRTFVPFDVAGKPHILAAYTCTPLVKFPLSQLKPGEKVSGVTIAELGNRNKPLDLIVYQKEGKSYLLLANSARGVMKISTDKIDHQEPIKSRVADVAGVERQGVESLKGVVQLDKINDEFAIVLIQNPGGFDLQTVALP